LKRLKKLKGHWYSMKIVKEVLPDEMLIVQWMHNDNDAMSQ